MAMRRKTTRSLALAAAFLVALPAAPTRADTPQPLHPHFRFMGSALGKGPVRPDKPDGPVDPKPDTPVGSLAIASPLGSYLARMGTPFSIAAPSVDAKGATLHWGVERGPLPPGVGVEEATGRVSGTPTQAGDFGALMLRAVSLGGGYGTSPAFGIEVLPAASLSYDSLRFPASGYASVAPRAAGLSRRARYDLTSGSLPEGLSLDPATGVIGGRPQRVGKSSGLVVTATDFDGVQAPSPAFALETVPGTATLAADSTYARTGVPYSNALRPSGLKAPVEYSLDRSSAPLPPGIQVDSAGGTLTGVPASAGPYPGIVVAARDADGTLSWTPPFSVTVSSASLAYPPATALLGQPFSVSPTVRFLQDGATYALTSGALPDGLTLDKASGAILGTPSRAGTYGGIVVTATDVFGAVPSASYSLVAQGATIDVRSPYLAYRTRVGKPFATTLRAQGAAGAVTWTARGPLPPGLALDGGGISGTPTAVGLTDGVVVEARDAGGYVGASPALSFDVVAMPTIAPAASYVFVVGQDVGTNVPVTGVLGEPYVSSSAALPAGLTLDSDGRISGTPTTPGRATGLVLSVSDSYDGAYGSSRPFDVEVRAPSTAFSVAGVPTSYATRVASDFASSPPTALNASGAVSWAQAPTSAAFPPGLRVDGATGSLLGTPTLAGTYPGLVLQARDASGAKADSQPFAVSVAPPLEFAPLDPTYEAAVGEPITVGASLNGLVGQPTYEILGASLPAGMRLDGATISGVPLAAGTFPDGTAAPTAALAASRQASGSGVIGLVIAVTDSFDRARARTTPFNLRVKDGLVAFGPVSLRGRSGTPFTTGQGFNVLNATGPVAWELAGGRLPDGLSLDRDTGVISGVPSHEGRVSGLTLRVRQASDGRTGVTRPFGFEISAGLGVDAAPLQVLHKDVGATFGLAARNAQGAVNWSVESGALPPGLALAPATGHVSGTPTQLGSWDAWFRATDINGAWAVSDKVRVTVNGGLAWTSTYDFPAKRGGTPFATGKPVVTGAVGKLTYKLESAYWDFKVDPDTGALSGTLPAGNRWIGYWASDPWVRATDETGASVRAPGQTQYAPYPITFYDCYRDCVRTSNVGESFVWQTGALFDILGPVSYALPRPCRTG